MCQTFSSSSSAAERTLGVGSLGCSVGRKVVGRRVRVLARGYSFVRIKGFRSLLRAGSEVNRLLSASFPRFCLGRLARPQVSAEAEFVGVPKRFIFVLACAVQESVLSLHP